MKRRMALAALAALIGSQIGVAHSQPPAGEVVLVSQNEELDAYDANGVLHWEENAFVNKHDWVNGPPCYIPGSTSHHFLEADDNEENGQEGAAFPWWGEFNMNGHWTGTKIRDADLAHPQGTLKDPAGCAFDENISSATYKDFFGADVGDVHAPVIGDGQLIQFFAPDYTTFCRLSTGLSQPGMIAFGADGKLYVPQAGAGVITRYSGLPTSAAQCPDGSFQAIEETWMVGPSQGVGTPIGMAIDPLSGDWAIASVLVPPAVFRVGVDGMVKGFYAPPGAQTGTPFGLDFDSVGNLYYADLGVRPFPLNGAEDPSDPIGPADGQGSLKEVPAGSSTPITIQSEMNFPDGVTVVPADWVNLADAPSDCDWHQYGGTHARSFGATPGCARINQLNVSTLVPKWFVNTSAPVTASPAVVGGKVYVGAFDGTFYKVDAVTGSVDKTFAVTDQSQTDYGKIVSSAAVTDVTGPGGAPTRVVIFGGGSTLYVLDDNLNVLQSACFDPHDTPTRCQGSNGQTIEIESSPAVINQPDGGARIIVGMDFNEDDGVGRAGVISLKLKYVNGQWKLTPEWKFDPETLQTYTTNPLTAGGTGTGCGNVWSSPTVDTKGGLIFFGVGNCDIRPDPLEAGDGEAIIALHMDGTLAWRYAPRAADNDLDLDFGATPNLLPGGRVGEGGKDGIIYALPRTSSTAPSNTPAWATPVASSSDIGGIIGSTALGESKGKQAIFATSAFPFSTRDPQSSFEDNLQNPQHMLALHAIDAETGENLWDAPIPLPSYSAATYANGVVFISDTFGSTIQAYNADNGTPLWAFPVNGAPSSGVTIVGDSIYVGSGTTQGGLPVLDQIGGIWGFQLAL